MFLEQYLPKINEDTGVALIHAVNPYGFYHYRRVNENNIDLKIEPALMRLKILEPPMMD